MVSSQFIKQRLISYLELMRVDKPIGTLLLLWPTLWALWLSSGELHGTELVFGNINPHVAIVFLCGTFLMRSAGCVINDFADRNYDIYVERTKQRPLTVGRVGALEAIVLFSVLAVLALCLVLTLDNEVRQKVLIVAVPALLIAVAYPFMKRFFVTPQLVLGIAFSFGIPMAFLAHGKGFGIGVLLLMLANIAWVVAYDTMYAMVDKDDDIEISIQSSALFFGEKDRLIIAALQVLTIVILFFVGLCYSLNAYYYGLILLSATFFVYQQWLIKDRDRTACFTAFLNSTWFGAAVLLAIVLGSYN